MSKLTNYSVIFLQVDVSINRTELPIMENSRINNNANFFSLSFYSYCPFFLYFLYKTLFFSVIENLLHDKFSPLFQPSFLSLFSLYSLFFSVIGNLLHNTNHTSYSSKHGITAMGYHKLHSRHSMYLYHILTEISPIPSNKLKTREHGW